MAAETLTPRPRSDGRPLVAIIATGVRLGRGRVQLTRVGPGGTTESVWDYPPTATG